MSRPPLDLDRPRDVSSLARTTLALYVRHLSVFLAIALAVVVPVDLVVFGIGLGQLTGHYDATPPAAATILQGAVGFLLTTPLVTAMNVHVVREIARGGERGRPRAREAIQSGLDAFAPLLGAVVVYSAAVVAGFLAFVVPGIYIAVKGYFVAQAVVVDGRRGVDALRRSWALTEGSWWRVLGITLLFNLAVAIPAALVALGLDAVAEASDAQAIVLASTILTQIVTLSLLSLVGTLLFFDLRARSSAPEPG